jgi:branched-subunit amino acid transport protein
MPEFFWLLIATLGVCTFLLRHAFSLILGRMQVPALLRAILPFIPAAALSTLVAPQILVPHADASLLLNPKLLAWLGAMAVAWKTRNMFLTLVLA